MPPFSNDREKTLNKPKDNLSILFHCQIEKTNRTDPSSSIEDKIPFSRAIYDFYIVDFLKRNAMNPSIRL